MANRYDDFDKYEVRVLTLDDEQHYRDFDEPKLGTIYVNVDWEDQPVTEPWELAHEFAEEAMSNGARFFLPSGAVLYIPARRIKKVYVTKKNA